MKTTIIVIVLIVAVIVIAKIIATRRARKKAEAEASAGSGNKGGNIFAAASGTTGDAASQSNAASASLLELQAEPAPEPEPEPEPTVTDLIKEADEHLAQFAYDDAADSLESALELAIQNDGADSIVVAQILLKLQQALQSRDNDDEESIESLEGRRALAIIVGAHGPFSAEAKPAIERVISCYLLLGKQSEADALMRRHRQIDDIASLYADSPRDFVLGFGIAFGESPDTDADDAISSLDDLINTIRQDKGREAVELIEPLRRLGRATQARDWRDTNSDGETYTDPATLFQLALSIAYLQYGPTDRRLVPIYNDLAAFWDQAGDHFKADGYVNQIRSILTA
ncbi:MAG: hypothetical protein J0H83_17645 [Candidatus Melainabacteria bacterium]|jgi:hypothetical protein|nr:hypothetical protein [Candidatus Melainabacteria bacterium]